MPDVRELGVEVPYPTDERLIQRLGVTRISNADR